MNFSVILDFSSDITAAIITSVVALIVGVTTAFLFWWATTKREKQQQKLHEEKMKLRDEQHEEKMKLADTKVEIQRLELLKSLSKLTPEQEEKFYEINSNEERLEFLIKTRKAYKQKLNQAKKQ